MILKRFEFFVNEVRSSALNAYFTLNTVRIYENIWYDADGSTISEDANCKACLSENQLKNISDKNVFLIPILDLKAVVICTYKQENLFQEAFVKSEIDRSLMHATYAYDAQYDSLTALLNRKSFEQESLYLFNSLLSQDSQNDDSKAKQVQSNVSMLALDVDLFKQVNDSFGHGYGDLVLKSLGRILLSLPSRLSTMPGSFEKVLTSRPSGEEFIVLAIGKGGSSDAVAFADELRKQIESEVTPTDAELQGYTGRTADKPNRRITVSIGVDTHPITSEILNSRFLEQLRSNADSAMYCSKAGGRNTVRHFSDILKQHGRVLESHKETQIICIDLGKRMGCKLGMEFIVYHPSFTGNKQFNKSDGRTSKTLGVYPRVPISQVVVFNVQDEISFCKLQEDVYDLPDEGYHLELVPLGAIDHLIKGNLNLVGTSKLLSKNNFQSALDVEISSNSRFSVVVIYLSNEESILSSGGTSLANSAVATCINLIKEHSESKTQIGQLSDFAFVVLVHNTSLKDVTDFYRKITDATEKKLNNSPSFTFGIFHQSTVAGDYFNPTVYNLAEATLLASYAALHATRLPEKHAIFTDQLAYSYVAYARKNSDASQAWESYCTLRDIGASMARFHNQGALIALESEIGTQQARVAILAALKLDPHDSILYANAGLIEFEDKNFSSAAEYFNKSIKIDESLIYEDYWPVIATAFWIIFNDNPDESGKPSIKKYLELGVKHFDQSVLEVDLELLKSALITLN